MEKEFNITGTCIPERHYMVDITGKLNEILKLIDGEKYFIINKPRQYGKTTTLFLLTKRLGTIPDYLPIKISFEGLGAEAFNNTASFIKSFIIQIKNFFKFTNKKEMVEFLKNYKENLESMDDLSEFIRKMVQFSEKKVVLMIDEVDKSSNKELFLDFLGLLRNKYLLRNEGLDYTFHSVILAGVHDVKSLKIKIRKDDEHRYNSPWNIASDFDVDMSFSIEEIMTLLRNYTNSKGVVLDMEFFADGLYFYTGGYPYLVSKLCKIIDEKLMPRGELIWHKEYMDRAVKEIQLDSNTNFDSLIKNLENNKGLYDFVKRIVLDGENIAYLKTDEIISLGTLYGILKEKNGVCIINNKVYEQLIYNHMMMKVIRSDKYGEMSLYNYKSNFIKEDNTVDLEKVLQKFQEFMSHEHSKNREAFLEHDGRLLFLAFLSPIINGTGFAFKEVTGGEEKRFDVVITYNKKMYILELKIWRGEEYHKRGLAQLGEYLNQYNMKEGYLIVFDFRKETGKSLKMEEELVTDTVGEKRVTVAYC